MTYTCQAITLELARILSNVLENVATGGATTYLIDTTLADYGLNEADDYWNGGTIWFNSGNNSGKSAVVSDYSNTDKKFTFLTQTGACAAADKYAVANKDYPKHELLKAINQALLRLGNVPQLYTLSTFVTVAHQEAYDLPAGVYNVVKVEIASSTSTPYDYDEHFNWDEINDDIVFDTDKEPAVSGYLIRLTYETPHAALTGDSSTLSDSIAKERLIWAAAEHALRWRVERTRGEREDIVQKLNEAIVQAERMAQRHPVQHVARAARLGRW